MTVSELRKALKGLPDDMLVLIPEAADNGNWEEASAAERGTAKKLYPLGWQIAAPGDEGEQPILLIHPPVLLIQS